MLQPRSKAVIMTPVSPARGVSPGGQAAVEEGVERVAEEEIEGGTKSVTARAI